jgi:hypothetical protein
MAVSPTRLQATTMVTDQIRLVDGALVGIGSVPADIATAVTGLISDFPQDHTNGMSSFRSRLASALVTNARDSVEPALINFVRTQVNSPEVAIQTVLDRLYDDLIANAETIQSRGITYGAATPGGGNTGTGTILRLTEDSEAYDLEATHLDTKTLTCTRDAQTGAVRHREQFKIEGERAGVDAIEILGSGGDLESNETRSPVSRDSVLANCGFEQFSLGSATFTAGVANLTSDSVVTGWELNDPVDASDPTLYDLVQTSSLQARDLVGTTPTSIRMTGAARLRQFFSVNGVNLALGNPYSTLLHIYPSGGADANIIVTWGSRSQTITLASLTTDVWNTVAIDLDQDIWPARFNTEDAFFQIEWTGTTGTVLFDELEALVPMFGFDGTWFNISGDVGLTGTPPSVVGKWLEGDTITFSDSLTATDSQLQQWLFRLFGRHLPHSGTPTAAWAEPF